MPLSTTRRPSLNRSIFFANAPSGGCGLAQGISETLSSVRTVPKASGAAATTTVLVDAIGCAVVCCSIQLRAIKAAMPPIASATSRMIRLLLRIVQIRHGYQSRVRRLVEIFGEGRKPSAALSEYQPHAMREADTQNTAILGSTRVESRTRFRGQPGFMERSTDRTRT